MRMRQTLFFAMMLLFFVQLFTLWIESIYRVSLMTLRPGREQLALLLLLLPLLLFLVDEKRERAVLIAALAVFLLARASVPVMSTYARVVVAGLGVSAFLVIGSYALSRAWSGLRGDIGHAMGMAILFSVFFRSWGSSIDISMEPETAFWGWLLILLALYLSKDTVAAHAEPQGAGPALYGSAILGCLGLFGSFTVIYLVLSSPAVVNAWSGASYLLSTVLLVCSVAGAVLYLSVCGRTPSARFVLVWTFLFALCLVGGLLVHTPRFPATAASPAVFVHPASMPAHIPFYLMFILSPVVMLNGRHAARLVVVARPRHAVIPVLIGMSMMCLLTVMVITSNVWGYMGAAGQILRNKFYLPFLLACVAMLLPFIVRPSRHSEESAVRMWTLGLAGWVLAALAVLGVYSRLPRHDALSQVEEKDTLTVMTYNMQQGSSDIKGTRNYRGQLRLLRQVGAEIIGLQESDTARPSGGNVHCVQYFADELGYHAYYGPNTISGTFGTAILSAFPLENPRTFFTYSDRDETGTSAADIVLTAGRVTVLNSHPAGSEPTRRAHVDSLLAEAGRCERVVAVGDYNADPSDIWYQEIAKVLKDAWVTLYPDAVGKLHPYIPKPAQGTIHMRRRIDHIFVSPRIEVLNAYYVPAPESETDHPAHWAVIAVR